MSSAQTRSISSSNKEKSILPHQALAEQKSAWGDAGKSGEVAGIIFKGQSGVVSEPL